VVSHKNKEHLSCRRISSFRIVGCLAMLIKRNPTLRPAKTFALKCLRLSAQSERTMEQRWLNNSAAETRSREMFTSDNNYIRHYGTCVIYDAHYVLCIVPYHSYVARYIKNRGESNVTTGFDKHITRKRSILPWPRATTRSSAQIASLYRRLMLADVGVIPADGGMAIRCISARVYVA